MAVKKCGAVMLHVIDYSQATSRREGELMSCRGCSRQFLTFTEKELETGRAAQKLRDALAIGGGGECPGRGWWWRVLKEANKPPCRPKYTKKALKTGGFPHSLAKKLPKTPFFAQNYF